MRGIGLFIEALTFGIANGVKFGAACALFGALLAVSISVIKIFGPMVLGQAWITPPDTVISAVTLLMKNGFVFAVAGFLFGFVLGFVRTFIRVVQRRPPQNL